MRPDVQALIDLGFEPFPCAQDKRPRVKWQEAAPPDGWDWREDDHIGVPLPPDTIAVDIDNIEEVKASGLEFTLTVAQGTRSGGMHLFYRLDGRSAPQVVRRGGLPLDTRVGGKPAKGYVIAWQPERWTPTAEWAMAPEWVYEAPKQQSSPSAPSGPMGTRWDILSWLGTIASRTKLTEAEYLALLTSARSEGRLVALDPKRPWTDKDLRVLASEAAAWEPTVAVEPELFKTTAPAPTEREFIDAADLLNKLIPPLQWRVPHLLAEGLALMAAPPKSGKSVLCYQLAVELAVGGELFGVQLPRTDVRYYALEDGERRAQSRIRGMLNGRKLPSGRLSLVWTAPPLGGGLEKEVHEWLTEHPNSLVVIDVLAMVRPAGGKSNTNAYNEDYGMLGGMKHVSTQHPGSTILIVTHDRKAGAEDWVTRVTGTRGVTGVADSVLFIHRKRQETNATLVATGRDQEDSTYDLTFDITGWRRSGLADMGGHTRKTIAYWLAEHGPAHPKAIADGTGLALNLVQQTVLRMAKDEELDVVGKAGYAVP